MESSYHGLMKHLLFVPRLSHALWVTDLFVWHSSPRLGKNDTIFILLSLDREQGISYTYMMGSAWKKTDEQLSNQMIFEFLKTGHELMQWNSKNQGETELGKAASSSCPLEQCFVFGPPNFPMC